MALVCIGSTYHAASSSGMLVDYRALSSRSSALIKSPSYGRCSGGHLSQNTLTAPELIKSLRKPTPCYYCFDQSGLQPIAKRFAYALTRGREVLSISLAEGVLQILRVAAASDWQERQFGVTVDKGLDTTGQVMHSTPQLGCN